MTVFVEIDNSGMKIAEIQWKMVSCPKFLCIKKPVKSVKFLLIFYRKSDRIIEELYHKQ